MNNFFRRIGHLVTTWPAWVTGVMAILIVAASVIGSGVQKSLTSGGFEDRNSDSYKASQILQNDFGQQPSNILLLVTAKNGSVDNAEVTAAVEKVETDLRQTANVHNVFSYWTAGKPASLKSKDGSQALVIATMDGTTDQITERVGDINPEFTIDNADITVGITGGAEINRQYTLQIEKDLKLAEMIALPITLILLLIVFRSAVAASLPLLIGVFSIMGTFFVLYLLTKVTDVSVYALNLTTMLGLGLAIDYSLFMVSRFRESLAAGLDVPDAVKKTVQSAGRTVLFSSMTVAISLATLLVFPQVFLRSFAFAGLAVAVVAALGSVVLLPAILMLLGRRVNALPIGHQSLDGGGSPFWHAAAGWVMKRPWAVIFAVLVGLLVLGYPFLSINLGQGDQRGLPASNTGRVLLDEVRSNFSSEESSPISIISTVKNADTSKIDTYATSLSEIKGIDHVETSQGIYIDGRHITPQNAVSVSLDKGTLINAVLNVEPISLTAEQTARDVRALNAPFPVLVDGSSASLIDTKDSILGRIPIALSIIAVATFVLLFLMFGSVLVPIKALVINILSLSASFGAMVWIFQQGRLANLLHFTATGMIDASTPILMFCIAFGLSMDYEVFLLSRIKEDYDKRHNNAEAVAHGLEKTGGIVSAAAVSISVIFFAFATSGVLIIKLLGLGLALAVLLDAFVIRGTLVPAFMHLAGDANWWMPRPLAWIYNRLKISESAD